MTQTPDHIICKHPKANIKIASLNMKGRHAARETALLGSTEYNKWKAIKEMMSSRRIGILAIQESHLDEELLESVKRAYGRWLMVFNSGHPETPRGAGGVAFAINRMLVPIDEVEFLELIPGRAAALRVKWHGQQNTCILNVYGPNKANEHETFWPALDRGLRRHEDWSPDFMLGDFNIVEDEMDRAPPRTDDWRAVDALREFCVPSQLVDTWRNTFPHERSYTFRCQTRNADGTLKYSHSRLDRIYVKRSEEDHVFEWRSSPCEVPTDHDLISVRYSPKNAPAIGPGRPTMPVYLIHREPLMLKIASMGYDLLHKCAFREDNRENGMALQSAYQSYKEEIAELWLEEHKSGRHKMDSRIKLLERSVKTLAGDGDFGTNEHKRSQEAMMNREIKHLYKKRNWKRLNAARAKWAIKSETSCKEWFNIGKEKKPRDMIYRLQKPTNERPATRSPTYMTRTNEMADIARKHHDSLQDDGVDEDKTELDRKTKITNCLRAIPEQQKLSSDEAESLAFLVSEDDVTSSLKKSKLGVSSGIDGLPTELWRKLERRNAIKVAAGEQGFDVVKLLTLVFWSIQKYGMAEGSNFSKGWMCPIYKKNDKSEISNYRPITVLNSDYKVLTKALTDNLARVVKTCVHPDQAGFIAGRSILDQVELSKSIIAFAESSGSDGAILALDQEKAYDKIRHDYLFSALEAFGLPDRFITTVKHLYSSAETEVAINGIHSAPYRVRRGVRQGDPLSCLLFNLAIEPLACAIRDSPNIRGIRVPGIERKLAIALFADDATVYLSKEDKFDDLKDVLDGWCEASGARFNIGKTELVPIGDKDYRNEVVSLRKINPEDTELAEHIRIAQDGDWVRVLGAPIGNHFDEGEAWGPTIEKIEKVVDRWKKLHPTYKGKRMIIQAMVGGMSQYRTATQGMPVKALKEIRRITRDFIWDNKRPLVNEETLQLPISEGGLGILDPVARNEAIDMERLRRYLNFGPDRATWAYVVDATINLLHPKEGRRAQRQNTFIQNWSVPISGRGWGRKLPSSVVRMLQVADKYNAQVEALRFSESTLGAFPAWHHVGKFQNTKKTKTEACLYHVHGVRTLADLIRTSKRLTRTTEPNKHSHIRTCSCTECKTDRENGCERPWSCAEEAKRMVGNIKPKMNNQEARIADGLSLTPNRKAKNRRNLRKRHGVIFDPSVTVDGGLRESIRIFVDPFRSADMPPARPQRPPGGITARDRRIVVFTDGSSIGNGTAEAKCGSGVWFGEGDSRNKSVRPPTKEQTNQTGEIAAIILAVQSVPPFTPLKIKSDSLTTIEGLTSHLPTWEDRGWIGVENSELLKVAAYNLRNRSAPTTFQWVKGHAGILGNEGADALAGEAAERDDVDEMDLKIPPEYNLSGAKLSALTQALAYRGIRRSKYTPPRTQTAECIKRVQEAIKAHSGLRPTPECIWKSKEHNDLRPQIRQFLFKSLHGIHKIGNYWKHIPGYTHCAKCAMCGAHETLSHALFECTDESRRLVWSLAEEAWDPSKYKWPSMDEGTVLGVGMLTAEPVNDDVEGPSPAHGRAKRSGASRRLRILISESMWLVWRLRCEWTMEKKRSSEQTVRARWKDAIEQRIRQDRLLATRKTLHKRRTEATWGTLINDYNNLPENWVTNMDVEVRLKGPTTSRLFCGSSPTLPANLTLPSEAGVDRAFFASD
jgi:ribonuclease HI/exonuclease III